MHTSDILILTGDEVRQLLEGQEAAIIAAVRRAYEIHGSGESFLPHSTFLTFPNGNSNRIIALPAYLGDEFETAGIKWISSFTGNLSLGLERASAVVILNSMSTGRPETILEGSLISAKRTAASAALAAVTLHHEQDENRVGLIGCGSINFEIVRFLRAVFPNLAELVLYDLDEQRSRQFANRCEAEFGFTEIKLAKNVSELFRSCSLVSLATTASQPHLASLPETASPQTVLHISLRDLSPEIILNADNVVDDADHVCRARTSLDLAAQVTGSRYFIRCSLA
ncbi:MAG TPA: 2,3-diaminopropionate biosynthesis protein SbnB, partial [Pyrinomonadaceae bacterium]|nr:2,3-diaminopropionate biosynthesis protein SbnB [Pyrinomonadaceae bacterium]